MCRKLILLTSFVLVLGLAGFVQAELLTNGDFEAGTESWSTWGSGSGSGSGGYIWSSGFGHSEAIEDGTAHSGNTYINAGFEFPLEYTESWAWGYCLVFQEVAVTEGKIYKMGAWFRNGDAGEIADGGGFNWEWRLTAPDGPTGPRGSLVDVDGDGDANNDKIGTSRFDVTEEWTYHSDVQVAPPGANGLTAILVANANNVNFNFDDASLTEVEMLTNGDFEADLALVPNPGDTDANAPTGWEYDRYYGYDVDPWLMNVSAIGDGSGGDVGVVFGTWNADGAWNPAVAAYPEIAVGAGLYRLEVTTVSTGGVGEGWLDVQLGWMENPADPWANYDEYAGEWVDVSLFGDGVWTTLTWEFEIPADDPGIGMNWYLWLVGESYDDYVIVGDVKLATFEPPPIVLNGDFELPGDGKINTDWDPIPGWSSDTPPADSGIDVEDTYPGYGYSAFLMDGDPSVWQTTEHIIAAGDQFTLSLVASDLYTDLAGDWSGMSGGQLTVSLYYDDGGTRTPVATTDIMPTLQTEMEGPFELAFNALDVPASIGNAIGIEIVNSSPTAVPNHSWVYFDDVQLNRSMSVIFLFDSFEGYADDAGLTAAGWTIFDTPEVTETGTTWTITNPGGRVNPATLNGSASTGNFLISDSDSGGGSNPTDSGASHDVITPSFSTAGADKVWLHMDLTAQLNNNGACIFDVDVSTDGGSTWTNAFSRVAPGRISSNSATTRLPDNTNTDGYYGQLDVDLTPYAANQDDVRLRIRHLEPNDDWYIAIDNVLVDDVAAPQGGPITIFSEDFSNGLGQMSVFSGQGNTGTETWHTTDKGGRYVPGTVQEQGVNRLGPHPGATPDFAIIDSDANPDPAEDEWLMTPTLDLSEMAKVFLHYESETVMSSGVWNQEVLVSLDGGSTFETTPIFAYTGGGLFDNGEEPAFAERIFDVSGIAAGQSQVVFAFRYTGDGDDWWWAIDNVEVSGISGNLVLNPSFEEDEAILDDPNWVQWATWNDPGGAGSNATIVDTEFIDGTRSLRVEPIGTTDWFFIVSNISFPLEVGTQYTATFWAKAEAPRPLAVSFKSADNSVSWGWTQFQLTTEWAEYTTTSQAENAEGKLEFSCAGVEVPFWLDLVSVLEED